MDASSDFWMAVGAIAAALSLGAAFVLHLVRYAYQRGVTDNRLAEVERKVNATADLAAVIASIQATVSALGRSIDRLDGVVERLPQAFAQLSPQGSRAPRSSRSSHAAAG